MSAWLPLLSACNLHCLTPLFFKPVFVCFCFFVFLFFSLDIARYVLGSLKC